MNIFWPGIVISVVGLTALIIVYRNRDAVTRQIGHGQKQMGQRKFGELLSRPGSSDLLIPGLIFGIALMIGMFIMSLLGFVAVG